MAKVVDLRIWFVLFMAQSSVVAQDARLNHFPDSLNKKRLHTTVAIEVTTYVAGLSFLQYIWYKDHDRVPFHYYNDSEGYLQMDKAGHAYAAYWQSQSAYAGLRKAGVSKKKALIYGAPMGLVFQTPIEVFDGLYEGWGFSWSDMAANAFGTVLFAGQELFFDEQLVLMKFSYSPSVYPNYHHHLGETHVERFFLDYNAHTYWLSGNANKLTGVKSLPAWLNIAIGYSANGMIYEFENPKYYRGEPFPELRRYRQFLFSLDVDLSKVPTNKKWVRKLLNAANYIKIPFPAVEFNVENGWRFRPLYF